MTNSLLLISIGPVQDFIASARRTRDLWFGSWLLSEMAKAAAKSIYETQGKEALIFPYPTNLPQDLEPNSAFNVPNKILVKIKDDPKVQAVLAHQALTTRLNEIREGAFAKVTGRFEQTQAEEQIDALVEFNWVSLPLSSDAKYGETRKQLEHLMAARKNTRNFGKVTWGDNVPKSSIDGERESVINERFYPPAGLVNTSPEYAKIVANLYRNYGINVGERLSGVDILKRHGYTTINSDQTRFLSTSHMAAGSFFERLELVNKQLFRKAFNEYLRKLPWRTRKSERLMHKEPQSLLGYYDGSLLFTERFNDTLEGDDLSDAQKALETFYRDLGIKQRPIPYYAILHADGDAMGSVINFQSDLIKHQAISKQLTLFAGAVKTIVDSEFQGALVYSGGDDVLAFLPLHTVLACAKQLATTFAELLGEFKNEEGCSPTLSVGIAIVHHLEPLSDALELARAAEKKAKGIAGKNALAINLSKRGGADRIIAGSWVNAEGKLPLYERLKKLIEWHQVDQIPLGFAFELHDLSIRLKDLPAEIFRAEAKRIIERKHTSNGVKVADGIAEQLLKIVNDLLEDENTKPHSIIQQFADEVIIAEFIDKANKLTTGE
ncbi:type III-B CRISPR-associated protein Cas10/Cmr2 [Herpetosiphon llansteffanensis]|uniref:type III-B CRISPR-associated protein Cas10/Cmr2 n=1 Tax=Herpetosiphon llansteffanensis TaxID=2094568 RepID=UPI000D7CA22D|nr:type III-B CRISPR-associated protein Cas10/Cmr2 [Herpetosiphon llansteffanensis]